jgi:hypothetical protein
MKNNIIYLVVATIIFAGCNKENNNLSPVTSPIKMALMGELKQPDFYISIFNNVPIRPACGEQRPYPTITAYGYDGKYVIEKPVGNLYIDDVEIPFVEYSYGLDARLAKINVTGKEVEFEFKSSTNIISDFNAKRYSPNIIEAKITSAAGEIGNTIKKGEPITFTVKNDNKLPDGAQMFVMIIDRETNEYLLEEIPVNKENYSVAYEKISRFGKKIIFTLYRGYYQTEIIKGKTLGTLFVSETWDSLHIE